MMNTTTGILTASKWPSWSKAIAYPADPNENSPAATERLMEHLLPYFVDIKGVRPQFHARNSTLLINFLTKEQSDYYHSAVDRFLEAMNKAASLDGRARSLFILTEFLKFRIAAEVCRSSNVAESMYKCVQDGKAAVYACNFKQSIAKTIKHLNEDWGVSRDQISIIWGGSEIFNLKPEDFLSQDEIKAILNNAILTGQEIPKETIKKIMNQFKAQEMNLGDLSGLDLGTQSRKQRQWEIDKFQKGETLYCFYTFKAGGIGLSLHHTDEMTKEKVRRRKKSGYAFEEDIPLIPTRPRETYLSPTYSAIELVQGLGRVPRITSLSDTIQVILFYKGTIEERVAAIVSAKLRCLKKVVRQRESWEDVIIGQVGEEQIQDRYSNAIKILKEGTDEEDENGEATEGIFLEEDNEDTVISWESIDYDSLDKPYSKII